MYAALHWQKKVLTCVIERRTKYKKNTTEQLNVSIPQDVQQGKLSSTEEM